MRSRSTIALALGNHFIKVLKLALRLTDERLHSCAGGLFAWELLGIMAGGFPLGKDFGFAFFSAKFSQSIKLVGLRQCGAYQSGQVVRVLRQNYSTPCLFGQGTGHLERIKFISEKFGKIERSSDIKATSIFFEDWQNTHFWHSRDITNVKYNNQDRVWFTSLIHATWCLLCHKPYLWLHSFGWCWTFSCPLKGLSKLVRRCPFWPLYRRGKCPVSHYQYHHLFA